MMFRRTLLTLVFSAAVAAASDPTLLNMVPKDPRMIAGVDIDRARSSSLGQRIIAEMKDEDKGLQELIASTGFDPRRDLREIVLASDGKATDRSLVIVRGSFDQSKINAFLRTKGAAASIYKGVELWADPKNSGKDGVIAFVNTSLALFGQTAAVQEAIDRRSASSPAFSADLQSKVREWSVNDAWFISTSSLSELGVNSDGKNKVMPQGISPDSIRAANAGVVFGKDILVTGEALTRSDKDAQALVDVVRFIMGMIRMNSDKPDASELLKVLDSMTLTTSGASMKFSLAIPEEQFQKMFDQKHNSNVRVKNVRHERQ